jgi:ribosome-associated protein
MRIKIPPLVFLCREIRYNLERKMNNEELKNWIHQNGILTFSRSGGPGGQHVNKTDTKAVLRIPVNLLPLSDEDKKILVFNLSNRINSNGELVIHSSSTRSQTQNREAAEERGCILIMAALKRKRKRRATKPTRNSKERRIGSKKIRSGIKKLRGKPPVE